MYHSVEENNYKYNFNIFDFENQISYLKKKIILQFMEMKLISKHKIKFY